MYSSLFRNILIVGVIATLGGSFAYTQYISYKTAITFSNLEQKINELTLTLASSTQAVETTTNARIAEIKNSMPKASLTSAAANSDSLLTSAVAKVSPSVVSIEQYLSSDASKKISSGTGVIVSSNGYIVTNKHVVIDDNDTYFYSVVLSDETRINAKVVYKDPYNDIAILKIPGTKYPAIHFADSNKLQVGQSVAAIGNALGEYNNSVSVGIISGLHRTIDADGAAGNERLENVIQTDAAINPGNSGGPLLDLNGNVVGINVATIISSTNISFAIASNDVKDIISLVIAQ